MLPIIIHHWIYKVRVDSNGCNCFLIGVVWGELWESGPNGGFSVYSAQKVKDRSVL